MSVQDLVGYLQRVDINDGPSWRTLLVELLDFPGVLHAIGSGSMGGLSFLYALALSDGLVELMADAPWLLDVISAQDLPWEALTLEEVSEDEAQNILAAGNALRELGVDVFARASGTLDTTADQARSLLSRILAGTGSSLDQHRPDPDDRLRALGTVAHVLNTARAQAAAAGASADGASGSAGPEQAPAAGPGAPWPLAGQAPSGHRSPAVAGALPPCPQHRTCRRQDRSPRTAHNPSHSPSTQDLGSREASICRHETAGHRSCPRLPMR
ncbi:hypothetical protein NKH18_15130 [Streptomyces sp. M10(2022)]